MTESEPKFVPPMTFTRTSATTFTTPADSHPGNLYVLSVITYNPEDGQRVFCTCQGSTRRGPDTCKHARELRAQGLHRVLSSG